MGRIFIFNKDIFLEEFSSIKELEEYLGYVPLYLIGRGMFNYGKNINGSIIPITVINYDYYFRAVAEGIHASNNTDLYFYYFELIRTQTIDSILKEDN